MTAIENMAEPQDGSVRKQGDPCRTSELFKEARYITLPQFSLTQYYLEQVKATGLLFISLLVLAYDMALHKHRGEIRDGWFALSDSDLKAAWGCRTTQPIREARQRVLAATPQFLADYREGHSGRPSEYRLRSLSSDDAVSFPRSSIGMPIRLPDPRSNQVAGGSGARTSSARHWRSPGGASL